jgi:hypothetical protein
MKVRISSAIPRSFSRCSRDSVTGKPTRVKEMFYLDEYIVPHWGKLRLNQIQPKAVEDWLHTTFDSWWTMHGVRAIMTRIYNYAEGHGLWEVGKRSPVNAFLRLRDANERNWLISGVFSLKRLRNSATHSGARCSQMINGQGPCAIR